MAENESQSQTTQKGGDKKKGIILGVVVVLVIAVLIGIIIYLLMPKDEKKRNVLVSEENVEETAGQLQEAIDDPVEPGYYTATMNYEWHFPDGSSASTDAYVKNVEENTNDVYFDVYVAGDTENVIYESPVIPRGSELKNITLDTTLEKGTYDCVVEYHLIDEEQNSISTVSISVTLFVEN